MHVPLITSATAFRYLSRIIIPIALFFCPAASYANDSDTTKVTTRNPLFRYEGVDIVYIITRTHNVINIIIDEKKHQQFVDLNLYWI